MLMQDGEFYTFFALGLIAVVCFVFARRFWPKKYPYYSCETLLTNAELRFYKALERQLPAHIGVSFKTRLNDVITCDQKLWHKGYGPKIAAKHIDFVLYDKSTTKIIGCIELDDRTHERKDRKRRDDFVNKALAKSEVSLQRIKVKKYYSVNEISGLIRNF
tara:strand:+ start:233 stop:715 length:483 start_codon:yes stop_codon:yes gene_type:complete